jgi:hypothetical protein
VINIQSIIDNKLNTKNHQKTADKAFNYLRLETFPMQTNLKKISSDNLDDDILDYSEIVDFIRQT